MQPLTPFQVQIDRTLVCNHIAEKQVIQNIDERKKDVMIQVIEK
jgi:hypothetical protein